MAISHVCLGCGMDLARVRAVLDPHYRLWVVTCPTCGSAAVRSRGGVVRAHRRWRRLSRALSALVFQAGFAAFLLGMLAAGAATIATEMSSVGLTPLSFLSVLLGGAGTPRAHDWALNEGLLALMLWSSLAVVSGMWLTAGLAHLSRMVWAVWAAALLVLVNIEWLLYPVLRAYGNLVGSAFREHVPSPAVQESRVFMAAAALLLAAVGIPLGRQWASITAWGRRARRRRYRALQRRLQTGNAP